MARVVRLVQASMSRMKLRVAWEGITYVRITLWVDRLIMEGDSLAVVAWLQGCLDRGAATHPLVCDI